MSLATGLNEVTKREIRRQLAEGFEQGESIPKLTRRIRGYFDDAYKRRAPMVARTEVISASNEGALRGYEEQGIEKVEFYPAPDACELCEGLAGEYPVADSHGMITGQTHPNCSCVFLAVVE